MSRKGRRYALKSSDVKSLLCKTSERLGINLNSFFDAKVILEAVEAGKSELLLVNKKPLLFRVGENVYPTLFFEEILATLPKVVVDMGAVRHLCNGADIMAPGVVKYEGEFKKGALVLVVDVKYGKRLALGEIQHDADVAKSLQKGVVVKNVHFVSDEVWNAVKALEK